MDSAFLAVLDAEKAGVNVSSMLVDLNNALNLLSSSKVMLSGGDLDGAAAAATRSTDVAQNIRSEALSLKASTIADHMSAFRLSAVMYLAGVGLFLSLMVLAWQRFREHYVRRAMDLRPVVVTDVDA